MSQDKFEWTDTRILEFVGFLCGRGMEITQLGNELRLFKEEKTKRDWEVLALKRRDGAVIEKGSEPRFDTLAKLEGWAIYTVCRLSDGELFSIGDEVEIKIGAFNQSTGGDGWQMFKSTVTKINVWDNKVSLECGRCSGSLTNAKKVTKPKPLFNWVVFEKDGYGFSPWVAIDWGKDFDRVQNDVECFGSKEKAESYIALNKPRFSLKEIHEVMFLEYGWTMEKAYDKLKAKTI
jgi:hypothetical protein